MTSISSTTATHHHKHHKVKPPVQGDGAASASSTVDALAGASGTPDSGSGSGSSQSSVSIDKLLSQVIDLLQKLQASSASDSSEDGDGEDGGVEGMVAAMDTNQDGIVTSAEFVAARPSDVSEDQAARLFQSFDTAGSGSLSVADLSEAMRRDRGRPPAEQPGGSNDLFSALDTDKDGTVSRDELNAGLQRAQAPREDDITALLRLLGGKDDGASA